MLYIPCQRIATNTKLAYLSNSHLLIKQLMLCFSIKSALFLIFSFSATLAVDSTRTFEPKAFILSVSMAVLAMRMRAFSRRSTFFSRRKPFDESVCVCVWRGDGQFTYNVYIKNNTYQQMGKFGDGFVRTHTHTHTLTPSSR